MSCCAQPTEVRSSRGELVDFNGTVYTIRTRLGTLNIPAAEVTCIGEGCPALEPGHLRILDRR